MNHRLNVGLCLLICAAALPARAAILTSVPMQGGMVMPEFRYLAAEGSLTVTLNPEIPQLTPLLISHPLDWFAPEDPWYEALDPSEQGLAFSRRYGFTMDDLSESLPLGTAIMIRILSMSPGLGVYKDRDMGMKLWVPIFGTHGSATNVVWNSRMFHPTFTAVPGTNEYTATFDACLVNTNTLQEIAGTRTEPFVFRFTSIPDGRPELTITPQFALRWTPGTGNYVLEWAESFPATTWTEVTDSPIPDGDHLKLQLTPAAGSRFYRMRLVR